MRDKPTRPRVGTVILHHTRPELAAACLNSLSHQTYPLQEVVLVDNGSDDRFDRPLDHPTPAHHILRLSENRGFAGGVNAGIQWLNQHADVDCVWLLNNDTLCPPRVLEEMVSRLYDDPECGAVSAILEEQKPGGGLRRIAGGHFPLRLLIPFVSEPGDPVDYLCGACMLLRREALLDVGPLDESYFFFFEDVDWCLRARRKNWHLSVCERTTVLHRRSSTIGGLPRLRAAYYRRSHIHFLRNNSKAPRLTAALSTAYRLITDGVRGRRDALAGTLDGWRQGWESL